MSEIAAPHSAALADASVVVWDDAGQCRVRRLITRGSAGSDLQAGVLTIEPGGGLSWTTHVDENRFESHFVVRGRLKVSWSRDDGEHGELEVSPNEVFFYPPGFTYELQALGDEQLFVVIGLTPPTV